MCPLSAVVCLISCFTVLTNSDTIGSGSAGDAERRQHELISHYIDHAVTQGRHGLRAQERRNAPSTSTMPSVICALQQRSRIILRRCLPQYRPTAVQQEVFSSSLVPCGMVSVVSSGVSHLEWHLQTTDSTSINITVERVVSTWDSASCEFAPALHLYDIGRPHDTGRTSVLDAQICGRSPKQLHYSASNKVKVTWRSILSYTEAAYFLLTYETVFPGYVGYNRDFTYQTCAPCSHTCPKNQILTQADLSLRIYKGIEHIYVWHVAGVILEEPIVSIKSFKCTLHHRAIQEKPTKLTLYDTPLSPFDPYFLGVGGASLKHVLYCGDRPGQRKHRSSVGDFTLVLALNGHQKIDLSVEAVFPMSRCPGSSCSIANYQVRNGFNSTSFRLVSIASTSQKRVIFWPRPNRRESFLVIADLTIRFQGFTHVLCAMGGIFIYELKPLSLIAQVCSAWTADIWSGAIKQGDGTVRLHLGHRPVMLVIKTYKGSASAFVKGKISLGNCLGVVNPTLATKKGLASPFFSVSTSAEMHAHVITLTQQTTCLVIQSLNVDSLECSWSVHVLQSISHISSENMQNEIEFLTNRNASAYPDNFVLPSAVFSRKKEKCMFRVCTKSEKHSETSCTSADADAFMLHRRIGRGSVQLKFNSFCLVYGFKTFIRSYTMASDYDRCWSQERLLKHLHISTLLEKATVIPPVPCSKLSLKGHNFHASPVLNFVFTRPSMESSLCCVLDLSIYVDPALFEYLDYTWVFEKCLLEEGDVTGTAGLSWKYASSRNHTLNTNPIFALGRESIQLNTLLGDIELNMRHRLQRGACNSGECHKDVVTFAFTYYTFRPVAVSKMETSNGCICSKKMHTCYCLFALRKIDWMAAAEYCSTNNMSLLTTPSDTEWHFIEQLFGQNPKVLEMSQAAQMSYIGLLLLNRNATSDLRWIENSPLSFQNWLRPHARFFKYSRTSNHNTYHMYMESFLQPLMAKEQNITLCTAFVIYSSLRLEWVTVPCTQRFSRVLLICERPYAASKPAWVNHPRVLGRQYVECADDWAMIDGLCYQMFNIPRNITISCSGLPARCHTYAADLTFLPESGLQKDQRELEYFFSWLRMPNELIIGKVDSEAGGECPVWRIQRSIVYFIFNAKQHGNSSKSFICHQEAVLTTLGCGIQHFLCNDGTCILSHYECDGVMDCPDASDEMECEHVCNFITEKSTNESVRVSLCYDACSPGDCICHDLYYQCPFHGGCIAASKLCDGKTDCKDGQDERMCPTISRFPPARVSEEKRHFNCSSTGSIIPAEFVNDLIPDCPGYVPDDEVLLLDFWHGKLSWTARRAKCPETSTACVKGFELRCYPRSRICVFEVEPGLKRIIKHCRNGGHLANCSAHVCPSMYKCPQSYCIPLSYVCNSFADCPHGEDELDCKMIVCPGLLRCRHDDICVHPNAVDDLQADCPRSKDDESLSGMLECPNGCQCLGLAIACHDMHWTNIPPISQNTRKITIVGNNFLGSLTLKFPNAIFINLTDNEIPDLSNLRFSFLGTLVHLVLARNSIRGVATKQFASLGYLEVLELQENPIQTISPFSFCGLSSLHSLNISHLRLQTINQNVFYGLQMLAHLDLSHNHIKSLEKNVFAEVRMSLKSLHVTANPLEHAYIHSFTGLPNLQHLVVDSESYCFYLAQTVKCTYTEVYGKDCCKLIKSKPLEIISLIIFGAVIGVISASVSFSCTRVRHRTGRLLNIAYALAYLHTVLYTVYSPLVSLYYGTTFALYRPIFVKSYHCVGIGLIFYIFRHITLGVLVLGSMHRYEVVSQPFRNHGQSVRWYAFALAGMFVIMLVSYCVPLYLIKDRFLGLGSACLTFPVSNRQQSWVYFLVEYAVLDFVLHALAVLFPSMMVVAIRHSSCILATAKVGKVKILAIKRGLIFACFQTGSFLVSLVMQILAVSLEFGDQETVAMALVFSVQLLLEPVFFTFSTRSFRDWILRRHN